MDDRLRLLQTAAFFDLTKTEERRRSMDALVTLFFDLQDLIRPKTFLEIGAFEASFSRQARERYPHAKVFAFEASPYNYKYCLENFDLSRIDYNHLAISDKNGSTEFLLQVRRGDEVLAKRVKGNDSLFTRTEPNMEYERVTVPTTTLDHFLADAKFATDDFSCWIDVEGATELVFAGAGCSIDRIQSIFIEVEEQPYWRGQWLLDDVEAFLNARGFRAVARDFEAPQQFNVIFVREAIVKHFMFMDRMVSYITNIGRRS